MCQSTDTWDQRPCKKEGVHELPEVGVTVLVPLQGKQSATKGTNCIGSHCSCINGRMACCI